MNSRALKILWVLGTFFFFLNVSAQQVMFTPSEFVFPVDKESDPILGQPGQDFWMVFSDRANNTMYSDESCSVSTGDPVHFMRSFIVIKESSDGSALRIVDNRYVTEKGVLKDGYQSNSGWMKKTNLLLSRRCLKTRNAKLPGFENGIFNKKALVLNIVSETTSNYEPPKYFSNPGCTSVIDTALIYQINFVFKETETAYLLAEDELINPDDVKKMKGWVLKEKTTPWNHNLAFEANWDKDAVKERNNSGIKAKIFEKTTDVEKFYVQKATAGFGHIPYDEVNPTANRPYGEVDRFPALNYNNATNKWQLGVVGSLIGPNGEKIPKEIFDELKHVIDSVSINIRKVNIVFVIDGTSSILPYKDYVISAVMNTLDDLNRGQEKIFKFGAALYRDAPEESKAFQAYTELVTEDQIGRLTSWITANMVPAYNKCDTDLPESVFYGVKKAINHYALKAGQSNFIILIGDCGNHDRIKYMGQNASGGCASVQKDEFTNITTEDLSSLMAKNDINMLAFQVHHEQDSSYSDFVHQVGDLYVQTAKVRFGDTTISKSSLWNTGPSFFLLDTNLGGAYRLKCPVNNNLAANKNPLYGSLSEQTFEEQISEGLKFIDYNVDAQIIAIVSLLKEKVKGDFRNLSGVANIISKLHDMGLSDKQIALIFDKNGQLYLTGYTMQTPPAVHYPVFLDVLLTNHDDLYSIKYALENLIPTKDFCKSPDEFRTFVQDTWYSILVEQLKYFPPDHQMVDNLTLYQLASILTGWGGKDDFKKLKLEDVVDPTKLYDEDLYRYLIDWMITKGHVQSIFEGQNMFTKDYFRDHVACYFIEFLIADRNAQGLDPYIVLDDENLEKEIIDKLSNEFKPFNAVYKNIPHFRIPIGESESAATTYYWIDSRIFPHKELHNKQMAIYEEVLNDFKKRFDEAESGGY
jgi:hypothetical protein